MIISTLFLLNVFKHIKYTVSFGELRAYEGYNKISLLRLTYFDVPLILGFGCSVGITSV